MQDTATRLSALQRVFLVVAFLVLPSPHTRAHDILIDMDPNNDWIGGLSNYEDVPCCGSNDCYPLPAAALDLSSDGSFRVEIGGSWFIVPESSLLRDRSPDGRPWVCPEQVPSAGGYIYSVSGVRCLLLPLGV